MATKPKKTEKAKTPKEAGATAVKPVWVTPAMAIAWLETNKDNRKISNHRITRYAEDMARGNWRITGDSIRFAEDGRLLDGQHRLWACVESDTPFQTVVFTGVNSGSQLVMDQGMGRTRGSQLNILGYKRGRDLASACTAYWRMEGGRKRILTRAASPSNSEIYDLLEQVPALETCLEKYYSRKSQSGVRCQSGASIAMYVYFSSWDEKKADSFFEGYLMGVGLTDGSPALALRERVLQYRHKGWKIKHDEFMTWMAYAWKAHAKEKKLNRISCRNRLPEFPGSPKWDSM